MTHSLHICTICCQLDIVYDVISGRNVKTIEGCLVVNAKVTSSNNFRDIKINHFMTAAEADIDDSIKRKHIRVSLNKID